MFSRMKDFDSWNRIKKQADSGKNIRFAHPREVWWCMLGANVGAEIDGKNNNFERPVVVIRVYNKETLFVLPVTSKQKDDRFHVRVTARTGYVWVKLTQGRVISSQRLLRKIDTVNHPDFNRVRNELLESL